MVTSGESWILIEHLAGELSNRGMDVHVSADFKGHNLPKVAGIAIHDVPMRRSISMIRDLGALKALWRLVSELRPELVVAGTPKAGLLGMLASSIRGVPVRVYVLHGLRLESERGPIRWLLMGIERISMGCAHRIIAVSRSLQAKTVELSLAPAEKVTVLGDGSATGVEWAKFNSIVSGGVSHSSRKPVLAFVGRVTRDKGLEMLGDALGILQREGITGTLLVVGGDDSDESSLLRRLLDDSGWNVRHMGHVVDVANCLAGADILCLPSRREGFGTVVLEAAALEIPTVGTSVTGLVDSVEDGVTGILVPYGEPGAYADALRYLILNPDARLEMGRAASKRALELFSSAKVMDLWGNYLENSVGRNRG